MAGAPIAAAFQTQGGAAGLPGGFKWFKLPAFLFILYYPLFYIKTVYMPVSICMYA